MLRDFLPLMLPACVGGGAFVGYLIRKDAPDSEFSAANMFLHTACEVVCFSDVEHIPAGVEDSVLTRRAGRHGSRASKRIVLDWTARFVD